MRSLALLAAVVSLLGCEDSRRARDRDRGDRASHDEYEFRAPKSAAKAATAYARCVGGADCLPDVTFYDTQGVAYRRDELSGKVVVLSFWAEWCGPCAEEGPILSRVNDAYRHKDVVILGITVDRATAYEIDSYARRLGITYPVLGIESLGGVVEEPSNLPTTWVYDKYGSRVEEHQGVYYEYELTSLLDRLVAQ